MANEYSEFGKPYRAFPLEDNVADCCLGDSPWNGWSQTNLDNCPEYMSGRCAVGWDGKCDRYFNGLSLDDMRFFLQKTASKKYCRLADGSNCSIKCDPFNPVDQESPEVCSFYGNETLLDTNATIDVGNYTSVNMSPDYFGKCSLTCDKIDKISADDVVINNCITSGLCEPQLQNICQIVSATGQKLNNPALATYCQTFSPSAQLKTSASRSPFSMSNFSSELSGMIKPDFNFNYLVIAVILVAIIYFYMNRNSKCNLIRK
jgi:hypothetical protein